MPTASTSRNAGTFSPCLSATISSIFFRTISTTLFCYAADFLAGGLTGVARNYVQQDSTASREHLENILYSLFSGSFFR